MLALAALALTGVPASASSSQESTVQDDPALLSGTDSQVDAKFATLQRLGVDRLRVSMLWNSVAPQRLSTSRPSFGRGGASDPAGYPSGSWNAYDRVVNLAARHRLAIHFSITGPAPLWATANPGRDMPQTSPRVSDFRDFAIAVGRRYSGGYPAPSSPTRNASTLPRVSMWSIWNEPNQNGWLRPQAVRTGGRLVPSSPRLYRDLEEAGYAALGATGHGGDRILLGETAPRGSKRLTPNSHMRPLLFIRDLYCVDRRIRPLHGGAARARGCPATRAEQGQFVARHPGLFRSSGFAHHPYTLEIAPHVRDKTSDQVTLVGLPRLTRTLDRIFRHYGKRRRLGIWITEYGYQSNPPDPIAGFPLGRQAAFINEAEEITYSNRRVRSMAQFLLIDEPPNIAVPPGHPRYWGSAFQTGLLTRSGARKPSFGAYERPVNVTPRRARPGGRLRVWGGLRSAPNGARLTGALQFRAPGGGWRTVRSFSTRSLRNYVTVRTRARGRQRRSGSYRLVWNDPRGGPQLDSRSVSVRVVNRRR